jgi:hypothetical protein
MNSLLIMFIGLQYQALADFIADWTPGAQDEERTKDNKAWKVSVMGDGEPSAQVQLLS